MKAPSRGFTLLEVMVALSIFALLSIALYSAAQHIASNSDGLTERSLMHWIADNRMNELRATMRPITNGVQQEQIEFGGRSWQLTSDIGKAPDRQLRKIELTVSTAPMIPAREIKLLGYIGVNQ